MQRSLDSELVTKEHRNAFAILIRMNTSVKAEFQCISINLALVLFAEWTTFKKTQIIESLST